MLNCVAKLNFNVYRKGCRSRYMEALKILQFLQPLISIKCSIKLEMPCYILRTILQYCIYYYFIALILFYSCKIVTVLKLRVLPCTYKCPHFIFKYSGTLSLIGPITFWSNFMFIYVPKTISKFVFKTFATLQNVLQYENWCLSEFCIQLET